MSGPRTPILAGSRESGSTSLSDLRKSFQPGDTPDQVRDLASQAAVLRGIAPVDGFDVLGQPPQVRAETRHRVLRHRNSGPRRRRQRPRCRRRPRWPVAETAHLPAMTVRDLSRRRLRPPVHHCRPSRRKPRVIPGRFASASLPLASRSPNGQDSKRDAEVSAHGTRRCPPGSSFTRSPAS
ncbi:MAG: hypothetical protein MZV63_23715 [Marinilabiliales bacterium]|nr:hypothetical protein [Marinilabiliales bacterium]